ncbi:MAG TPA: sugar phosphate isomerase/epimerase [Armatimonadetes bacterium]|nr:sugar phosphate isomerase/epimerase [Armatimonadota bacterium]
MKFSFLSSVYPSLSLAELLAKAQQYGYEGLELRVEWGHQHGVELAASAKQRAQARQQFADQGLACAGLATGVRFISPEARERAQQVELLKKYLDLAAEVGAACVRIFGDPVPTESEAARRQAMVWEAEGIAAVDDWAGRRGVTVCLETHGNLLASWATQILEQSGAEHAAILWHAAHHVRHGQSVEEAWSYLQGKIRHGHVNVTEERVPPDEIRRTFELLQAAGFTGFYSVEVINPPDPEAVLKQHAEYFAAYRGGN